MSILNDIHRILVLHKKLIDRFGGMHGVRDRGLLESAIQRPFHGTSNGREFFDTIEEKAAALLHGIIKNHPFVDGNKRMGFTLALRYLQEHGFTIDSLQSDVVQLCQGVADSKITMEEVRLWIQEHTKKK